MIATITKQRGDAHADRTMEFRDDEMWQKNLDSQVFMFKTMLTCHLGQLQRHDKDHGYSAWQGSVANAFAHCSRVMISLPGEKKGHYSFSSQNEMIKRYGPTGFDSRGGATHSMSRKKKGGRFAIENKK